MGFNPILSKLYKREAAAKGGDLSFSKKRKKGQLKVLL